MGGKIKLKYNYRQDNQAAQDDAKVLSDSTLHEAGSSSVVTGAGSNYNVHNVTTDQGAIERALDFARLAYEKGTSTVESAMDSVKLQANEALAGVKGAYAENSGRFDNRFVFAITGLALAGFIVWKKR